MPLNLSSEGLGAYRNQLEEERKEWMVHAYCRESEDNFFPDTQTAQRTLVKEYCSNCPVRLACLEYAVVCNEHDGVWGAIEIARRTMERRLHGGPREVILANLAQFIEIGLEVPRKGRPSNEARKARKVFKV